LDFSASLKIEMKFKLATSLSLAVLLVGVAACGGSGESRTRNAALAPCEGSAVDAASKEYIATLSAELGDLLTTLQVDEVFVVSAQTGLAEARAAGTDELTQAVKNFDTAEAVFTMVDAQIKEWKTDGYWESMGSMMNDLWVRELASANTNLITAKAEMERLLIQKAAAIQKAVDIYNAAVKKRDENRAAYNAAIESYNNVVLVSSGRNCPVLTAGDAETYVRDVAATTPPTTAPRLQFQFIDEPLEVLPPEEDGDVNDASSDDGELSSTTTVASETTVPSVGTEPPTTQDNDVETTTTLADSIKTDEGATVDTLPLADGEPSVEYVAPTLEEILEDISERLESFDTDTPISEQNIQLVEEILTSISLVSAKISSGEFSPSVDQVMILSTQISSLLVVTSTLKKKNYDSSSSSSISKFSVSVSASGFSPGSDVVFANRSGRTLRQNKANKDGIALFDADIDFTTNRDIFIMGGRNSAGDVVAVPVLVEFEENSETTGSTVPDDDSSTETSVVDSDVSDEANGSSGSAWIVWLLVVLGLLAIAYGIRKQIAKRGNDAN
jgi:hypothetical protein